MVILHHTGYGCEHWDLMLEHGGLLATWQLLRHPGDPPAFPIPAIRIGDHRTAYLEYEGPVSGDRGRVERVDRGTLVIEEFTGDVCRFVASGGLLSGRFSLTRRGERWQLDRAPEDSRA